VYDVEWVEINVRHSRGFSTLRGIDDHKTRKKKKPTARPDRVGHPRVRYVPIIIHYYTYKTRYSDGSCTYYGASSIGDTKLHMCVYIRAYSKLFVVYNTGRRTLHTRCIYDNVLTTSTHTRAHALEMCYWFACTRRAINRLRRMYAISPPPPPPPTKRRVLFVVVVAVWHILTTVPRSLSSLSLSSSPQHRLWR